jgi:hypothetical protein
MALTSKFYDHHLDVTNHEVRNVAYENLAAAPASPVTGRFYYDTTLKQHRYWDGTQWVGLPVGLYKGEGNTFATLPAAATAQNGDVAVLSADDIGSGTALALGHWFPVSAARQSGFLPDQPQWRLVRKAWCQHRRQARKICSCAAMVASA